MSETQLDKRLVVCPLSLMLGYVQNYRVNERPNKGALESRPVKGTDAFADDFFRVLHAEKGSSVEVELTGIIPEGIDEDMIVSDDAETGDYGTYKKVLKGLGQPEAQALKFPMTVGVNARARAIQMVNSGQVRAPKKNWDKTFGPEQTVTIGGRAIQIGGGRSVDELKDEFPLVYGQKSRTRAATDEGEMIDDSILEGLDGEEDGGEVATTTVAETMRKAPETEPADDLETLADEIEGDGAYASEEEEVYAAVATAEDEDLLGDLEGDEPSGQRTQERAESEGIAKAKADASHTQHMVIKQPQKVTVVKTSAIKFMDEDGNEVTAYKVNHPETGEVFWATEGKNCPACGTLTLEVRQ